MNQYMIVQFPRRQSLTRNPCGQWIQEIGRIATLTSVSVVCQPHHQSAHPIWKDVMTPVAERIISFVFRTSSVLQNSAHVNPRENSYMTQFTAVWIVEVTPAHVHHWCFSVVRGCISYILICDGSPNCADSSHEFCDDDYFGIQITENLSFGDCQISSSIMISEQFCQGFRCPTYQCINIRFVNDLVPNCPIAGDETHSLNIKRGEVYRCNSIDKIPCAPHHSKCFKIHLFCVYDHDNFGHIPHCRDGSHLFNCNVIKCTNTYKCPESYCVPLRKVCDGMKDCLEGEDEYNCENYICTGYLKCAGIHFCVQHWEACDGVQNCPSGDDEMLCDVNKCPTGCECLGHSVSCRKNRLNYIPVVATKTLIYFSIRLLNIYIPIFKNLTLVSTLKILDVSNSDITDICITFQVQLDFHDSLHVLDLGQNRIKHLSYVLPLSYFPPCLEFTE